MPVQAPLRTEEPLPAGTSSAFFHAPMPDRAITQHFLARKTTSAVIEGSGQDQVRPLQRP
jgi:hypothetical protein